jgi:HK97 family phage major capsid protein
MDVAIKEQLDALNREVTQLVTTVQEHIKAGDKTIDIDRLTSEFKAMLDEQVHLKVQAQIQAELDKQPVRKGELIGPLGFQARSKGMVEGGKFDGMKVDDLLFIKNLLCKAHRVAPERVKLPSPEFEKALTATGAGTGDEFVPTGMSAELWRDIFLASRVVSSFDRIPMPTDPYDIPVGWGDITWRKGTQNTAATVSDPATAKSTMTATEQVGEINWSYNLDEDSIIPILPSLKIDMGISAAEQMDKFMMNADATDANTGNINLDDANPADDSYYLSLGQDGLRHQILVDNTAQSTDINTTLTDALLLAALGKMGKYGVDPNQLVLFTNPKTYLVSMLGLTNLRTWDKYGQLATIVTGEVAKWSGIPVIPTSSIELAEDDGKLSTTASNNDEGTVLIVNRRMWRSGFRRELLIELDRNIQTRTLIMVLSFRMAVAVRGTRSTNIHTAGAHGITY